MKLLNGKENSVYDESKWLRRVIKSKCIERFCDVAFFKKTNKPGGRIRCVKAKLDKSV